MAFALREKNEFWQLYCVQSQTVSVAHSGFSDGKIFIANGLTWLGTNDTVVQISVPVMGWTVHTAGFSIPQLNAHEL